MFDILKIVKGGGYRYCVTSPPHPRRNPRGYYPLHRVLMENKIGRLLEPSEEVHHIDENKKNDDPSNLELLTKSTHAKRHGERRAVPNVQCLCGFCQKPFELENSQFRLRMRRNGCGKVFCSRSCGSRLVPVAE